MSKNIHKRALINIARNPEIIGINSRDVKKIEIEKTLREGGRIVAEPDVVLTSCDGEKIIIEYKSNGGERERKNGKEQLRVARRWYERRGFNCIEKLISGLDYPELKKDYSSRSSEGRDNAPVRRSPGYYPSF